MAALLSVPMIVLVLLLMLLNQPLELENAFADRFYQKPSAIPGELKIIAIDDQTLQELGPYSDWDREYFTRLLDVLNADPANSPRIIGIDIVFTGSNDSKKDAALAKAAKECGNIVLASKLDFSTTAVIAGGRYKLQSTVLGEDCAYPALDAVTQHGFTNAVFDDDGYIRSAYAQITSAGSTYTNFSYQIAKTLVEKYPADYPDANLDRGMLYDIVYSGKPGEFEVIPMSAVLSGEVPADYFADGIVLVGAYEEGMMDAYSVPIKHGNVMYGVEVHANALLSLLGGMTAQSVPLLPQLIFAVLASVAFSLTIYHIRLWKGFVTALACFAGYFTACFLLYRFTGYKLMIIYLPIAMIFEYLLLVLVRYAEMQKRRAEEIQSTLFSMADAMAEAIEGRSPYNAYHTKNVALRCVEMMEYINKLNREHRTDMSFSKSDMRQLYLAAMLHDIGKMDIPLGIMDKDTKLGNLEPQLRSRLEFIRVSLERDALSGRADKAAADERIATINRFLDNLKLFNCGKPLSAEEKDFIDEIAGYTYETPGGRIIPYIEETELTDLHIQVGTLSAEERDIMQEHVIYTDKILSHMYMGREFDKVRNIASRHHEFLNGKGYPDGLRAEDLDIPTRILTIIDIFDSLIAEDRPYKKPKTIPVAFEILEEEARLGKVDPELLAIAKELYMQEADDRMG